MNHKSPFMNKKLRVKIEKYLGTSIDELEKSYEKYHVKFDDIEVFNKVLNEILAMSDNIDKSLIELRDNIINLKLDDTYFNLCILEFRHFFNYQRSIIMHINRLIKLIYL
jgi:hypothetical protein